MRYAPLFLIFFFTFSVFSQYSSGVVHTIEGKPLEGTLIFIPGTSDSCRTDTNGYFAFYSSATSKLQPSGNSSTIISMNHTSFIINNSKSQRVSLTLFDLTGRRSAVLYDDILSSGLHQLALPQSLRNQTFIAVAKTGTQKQILRVAGTHTFSKSGALNETTQLSAIKSAASDQFEIRISHPGYDDRTITCQPNQFNDVTMYRKLNLHSNDTISIGDTLSLQNNGVYLSFDSINDQRCDCDVLCVWEGNATIYLTLTVNGIAHKVQLETYDKNVFSIDGYIISFVSLNECRQENPGNYQLVFSTATGKSVLFIEHFTTTHGTRISGDCNPLQIDFPTYFYNSRSGYLTGRLQQPLTDSTKIIFGEGVSLQGDAGGGIASGLQLASSIPFTSNGAVKIDSISSNGTITITYKGRTILLASGESWNADTTYIEVNESCSTTTVKKDRISNFGYIPFSHIKLEQ